MTSQVQRSSRRKKPRRVRIPDKPNKPLNLWSFIKNCIGKDLTKIAMPVNFSEPLSFLQRVAEDFTYSHLLDTAAALQNSDEQLAYVAAFAVTCYSSTADRTAKPFNPLLGETYELDRSDDYGWRLISEQVSHHPPISAQHCQSKEWTCWQEFAMSSKFRGKYLMVIPKGISHLVFEKSKNHYTWTKVSTIVNNLIIGKLWVDNIGRMEITNHSNSSKCVVNFVPYSMFRPDDHKKISGEVVNIKNEVKWIINGKWNSNITITPVLGISNKSDHSEYRTGPPKTIWNAIDPPEDSHKYYNFSLFACQLNEPEDGVAPTDSRNRPDQRLMEEGHWELANTMKLSLEENQRARRKSYRSSTASDDSINLMNGYETVTTSEANTSTNLDQPITPDFEAAWFKTEIDVTGRSTYVYKGGYWEAKAQNDWKACKDIYN